MTTVERISYRDLLLEMQTDKRGIDPRGVGREFFAFHKKNPHIYEALVNQTRGVVAEYGTGKTGMDLVYAAVRWNGFKTHGGNDLYAMNGKYTPFYARLIMKLNPDLDGVFNTRERGINMPTQWIDRYWHLFTV